MAILTTLLTADTLLAAGALAGKEALKKVVDSAFSTVSGKTQKVLKNFKTDREIGRLYTHLSKIRKVKTLGQLDKAVDLMTFYCPSFINFENKRTKITTLDDFNTSDNILIEGIAGQGKSIFLRYLSSVELVRGNVIPIFVELRLVGNGQNLMQRILATLKEFKLDFDDDVFSELANSGKFVLLLDAFDEVPDESKTKVLAEIDNLGRRHENLRIVVTSRPDSGIAACPQFHVVRLSDLKGDEFAVVIHKLLDEVGLANQLIKQVQQHKGGIQQLLITPLLVTLLVIRYKSFQELPEQLSDFYDSLFQLLLQRHDGVKPGWNRPRKCAINDFQYRQGFEALCFLIKKYQGRKLDHATIYPVSEEALKDRSITTDADHFLSDIVKITCLIVKDGEEYRFIHKSVQEYYAASYIRQKPDVVIEKLYLKLFSEPRCWSFEQELHFLGEIDAYRYLKFGVLPYLKTLFGDQNIDFLKTPLPRHHDIIKERVLDGIVEFIPKNGKYYARGFQMPRFGVMLTITQCGECDRSLQHFSGFELDQASLDDVGLERLPQSKLPRLTRRRLLTIKSSPKVLKALDDTSVKFANLLFEIGRKAMAQVEATERTDVFDLT